MAVELSQGCILLLYLIGFLRECLAFEVALYVYLNVLLIEFSSKTALVLLNLICSSYSHVHPFPPFKFLKFYPDDGISYSSEWAISILREELVMLSVSFLLFIPFYALFGISIDQWAVRKCQELWKCNRWRRTTQGEIELLWSTGSEYWCQVRKSWPNSEL